MNSLIPHGTACPGCLHPWWAHPAQHEPEAVPSLLPGQPPGQVHCIGEECACTRRQAGGVKRQ